MHTTPGAKYGKLAAIERGEATQSRRAEDIIVDRALSHLQATAIRDSRLADAHDRITGHVRHLRATVTERGRTGWCMANSGRITSSSRRTANP